MSIPLLSPSAPCRTPASAWWPCPRSWGAPCPPAWPSPGRSGSWWSSRWSAGCPRHSQGRSLTPTGQQSCQMFIDKSKKTHKTHNFSILDNAQLSTAASKIVLKHFFDTFKTWFSRTTNINILLPKHFVIYFIGVHKTSSLGSDCG